MTHDPDESVPLILSDVTRLFWRRLETALKAAGLDFTTAEARTLATLVRCHPLRQSELAELMRIEPMTLVGFLDRLEARGFLRRDADPADRRAKLVRPTEAGEAVTERIRAVAAEIKATVTADLAPEEIAALRAMLQRIRDRLDLLQASDGACAA